METVTNKKIITIAGKLGSGKSSAAKKIAKILNLEHFSSGDFYRKLASEKGMGIKDFLLMAENDSSIDAKVDTAIEEKGRESNLIIDSRLAFHWIPNSFKVYLDIDPDIASERMFYDLETNESRQKSEHAKNIEQMKIDMVERHNCDIRRYKALYGIDHTDHSNFDLVIDSGIIENDLDTVVKKVISGYMEHIKKAS